MRKFICLSLLFFNIIILLSCSKKEDKLVSEGKVELYLLESFETKNSYCQIIDSTIVVRSEPFITYEDFLSYNQDTYLFEITADAKTRIDSMKVPVTGTAFAIMANNEFIYSGYFWPAYSSMVCNWITIDPVFISYRGGLKVELGYPGTFDGQDIPDRRNDKRILDIFERDHKLK